MEKNNSNKDDEKDKKRPSDYLKFVLGPDIDEDTHLSIAIIAYIAMGILSIMILFGFAGSMGESLLRLGKIFIGLSVVLVPIGLFFAAAVHYRIQMNPIARLDLSGRLTWGLLIILLSICSLLNVIRNVEAFKEAEMAGGLLGFIVYPFLFGNTFGSAVSVLFIIMLFLAGFFLVTNMTFVEFVKKTKEVIKDPSKFMDFIPDALEIFSGKKKNEELLNQFNQIKSAAIDDKDLVAADTTIPKIREKKKYNNKKTFNLSESKDGVIEFDQAENKNNSYAAGVGWALPPFDILDNKFSLSDPGNIEDKKKLIQQTLENFGVEVQMSEVVVGPTITQFQLKPANGVRLTTISNLQSEIALATATRSIRIQAPIPGKSLVGIEMPNDKPGVVKLKQLLQTKEFVESEDLTVAVGKDVAGKNVFYKITKMPHLIVAGATGSGKSVWINGLILSLLFKYSPRELQMILVDMKRVELKLYDGVPHLLTSVITDSEKAINSLKWTVLEMEKRYQELEKHGKRNIKDFNEYAKKSDDINTLPYLVLVIDELADLMIMAKAEVEPIIVRLTQMSRAVGIHLILGTQRPSTDVVTGLIKANVPSRIAFAVASNTDSRVILDVQGAEKLLGSGDGLMITPSQMYPVRFQGPYVMEEEVRECVAYVKSQLNSEELSNLTEEVIETPTVKIKIPGLDETSSVRDGQLDDKYEEAKAIVVQYQKASASFLQQSMGVGYPKAAKIIMQLEANGVVGPQNGSKPRDVLISV